MHYIIYQTTNLLNNKIYVGAHRTDDLNDGYLGSGKAIQAAIRVHGRKNFWRKTLVECQTEEEMYAKEREIVTPEFVARPDTYNLVPGGERGAFSYKWQDPAFQAKMSSFSKELWQDDEYRTLQSEKARARWECKEYRELIIPRISQTLREQWQQKSELDRQVILNALAGARSQIDYSNHKEHYTDEVRGKMRAAKVGRIWVNNGEQSRLVQPMEAYRLVGEGWKYGRTVKQIILDKLAETS